VPEPRTAAASRARWVGKTQAQKDATARKARLGLAVKEIHRQIRESRRVAGLPDRVAAERFLDQLAAEVLGGGQDG
jgi:hypothetical protein